MKTLITLNRLFILIAFFCLIGCNKNSGINQNSGNIKITSLSLYTGPFGTVININGVGFSDNVADDLVFFNGKAATVSVASSSQITATVPLGAGTGNVTVSVKNGPLINGPVFTYVLTAIVSTIPGGAVNSLPNGIGAAPAGTAVDSLGNIYEADFYNSIIRKITPAGQASTFAGSGVQGSANGQGTSASFSGPNGIALDKSQNLYVADEVNNLIRKITPNGIVSTLAGNGLLGSANGFGNKASFNYPIGVAVDRLGNVYVADQGNQLIRKITPAGQVTTLAGSGVVGSADGIGTSASFSGPLGVAVDAAGNVYVADASDYLVRKITPNGIVSTLAGNGLSGSANGLGNSASFNHPTGVAVDLSGNVYVTDNLNNLIRKITPSGQVTTLAGSGLIGWADGIGTSASFYDPTDITIDNVGNLYITEPRRNDVRKISFE